MARKIQKSLEYTAKMKAGEWELKLNTKDCDLIELGNLFIGGLRNVCEQQNTNYIELIEYVINGEPEDDGIVEGEVIETIEVK